jgi:hypothetical protein
MSTTTVEVALQEQQELQSAVETFGPSADDAIVQAKQKWNDPPINKWRLLATFASFAVVGASDGVYGVRSPCTVKRKYRLMIFFSPRCSSHMYAVNQVHSMPPTS